METVDLKRPPRIKTAVNLLWATLAIGLIKAIIDSQLRGAQETPPFAYAIIIVVLAIMALLIAFISKGKNWARITFLVFFAVGMLPSIPIVFSEFSRFPMVGTLSFIQIALQLYALFIIFTKPGSEWYKKPLPVSMN